VSQTSPRKTICIGKGLCGWSRHEQRLGIRDMVQKLRRLRVFVAEGEREIRGI